MLRLKSFASFAAWIAGVLLAGWLVTACSDDLKPPPLNADAGVEAGVGADGGAASRNGR